MADGANVDQKIPFTSYDFWAYLSAGFLLLLAMDQISGTQLLTRDSWTVVQGGVAVVCAYTLGHLVASMSSLFFERFFVGVVLGYPRNVVLGQPTAPKWLRVCMPGYFKVLPNETVQRVLDKARAEQVVGPGEALFWLAYRGARSEPAVMSRLDNFLNLYGFCRNMALVSFMDAGMLYWSYRWNEGPETHLYFSWAAIAVGTGLIFRYLKFFRLFSIEVLTSFAYRASK